MDAIIYLIPIALLLGAVGRMKPGLERRLAVPLAHLLAHLRCCGHGVFARVDLFGRETEERTELQQKDVVRLGPAQAVLVDRGVEDV